MTVSRFRVLSRLIRRGMPLGSNWAAEIEGYLFPGEEGEGGLNHPLILLSLSPLAPCQVVKYEL